MTFNAGSVAFYVNGVQQGTTQTAVVNSLSQSDTNNFFTGAYSTNGGTTANAAFFDGKMDEVGVWNRALSANEVSQLYNGGSGRSYQSTPGITEGSGQTEAWQTQPYGSSTSLWAGATKPAPTAGSQSMSFSYGTAMGACDEAMVALRAASAPTVYVYPQTGYMNPDAVGSIGNGISTTTYTYDANGNLIQAGGWSYVWDYLNRMLASGYNNSTTTYAYDATGARVLQTSTTSTSYYPSKYFSLASTTVGGASYATSTNYIWFGDTLLGTIDQKLYNGTATSTAIARYVHPDHLGSTNVVTDASGTSVSSSTTTPTAPQG